MRGLCRGVRPRGTDPASLARSGRNATHRRLLARSTVDPTLRRTHQCISVEIRVKTDDLSDLDDERGPLNTGDLNLTVRSIEQHEIAVRGKTAKALR